MKALKEYLDGHTGKGIDRIGTKHDGVALKWRWVTRGQLSKIETRKNDREPCCCCEAQFGDWDLGVQASSHEAAWTYTYDISVNGQYMWQLRKAEEDKEFPTRAAAQKAAEKRILWWLRKQTSESRSALL